MTTFGQERATYADLEAVPPGKVAELIDGELLVSPRPGGAHSRAEFLIAGSIEAYDRESGGPGPGGWWLMVEPELHLGENVVSPDLAGWKRERLAEPESKFFTVAPDWVCEVLSPSTRRLDRERKMPLYAEAGCSHLWLVDPLERILEVYRLKAERWALASSFTGQKRVQAEPFEHLTLDLKRWWLPHKKT